jgi:hypothetical protein
MSVAIAESNARIHNIISKEEKYVLLVMNELPL